MIPPVLLHLHLLFLSSFFILVSSFDIFLPTFYCFIQVRIVPSICLFYPFVILMSIYILFNNLYPHSLKRQTIYFFLPINSLSLFYLSLINFITYIFTPLYLPLHYPHLLLVLYLYVFLFPFLSPLPLISYPIYQSTLAIF